MNAGTDHHRLMIERALQWQAQQDAAFLEGCAKTTSGEVSQYLSTAAKFLKQRELKIWPHEAETFLKVYSAEVPA